MKTYSKLLNHSALLLAAAFMLCSTSAKAESNNAEIPASNEVIELMETMPVPPSSLQIVSLIPVTYNGNVQIRCHGTSTGQATVEVTGGVPPYSYQWSNSLFQNGTSAYGMPAGIQTVIVTDAVGNTVSQSITLTQNPPLQAIANVTPMLCNGGVATISLAGSGGSWPYNGVNNSYQFAAGTYSFTISDANGCRDVVTTTIEEPPVLLATATVTAPILCHGDVTGVLVEATGGTGQHNGVGMYNEFAGNSSYIITDANGCYAYANVSINQPPVFAAAVNNTDIACRGGVSEVDIIGLGGTPPYIGTGNLTAPAGNYSYSIYDANGCQATSAISITQPTALVASISNTPVACNGDLSEVEVTATGGSAPYIGPGTFFEPSGYHEYTVEDANGCWVDIATIVIEPREMELDISWSPLSNGTADVLVDADGGTPAYLGTGLYTAGPGNHIYTVHDANGCSASQAITIATPITNPSNSNAVVLEQNNDLKSGNAETASLVQGSFNTSNQQIEISYELKYDSRVSVEVYDMSGALVESIHEDNISLKDEKNLVSIDSDKLTSGVYLYHFITNSERQVGKLQIVQ